KDHACKSLARTTQQQRITGAAVSDEPLCFAEMPRKDLSRSPSQRFEHRLVFSENALPDGDHQITIAALRIFLQALSRNRELFDGRAEAALDFPFQNILKFCG